MACINATRVSLNNSFTATTTKNTQVRAAAVKKIAVAPSASLSSDSRDFKASTVSTKTARDVRMYGEYGASSTSFYTTTEKQDSYDDLNAVLDAKCSDPMVKTVVVEMLDACAAITEALRS